MQSFINRIIHLGTDHSKSQCCNRNIILSNIVNLTLFVTTLFINIVEVILYLFGQNVLSFGTYRISIIALISVLNLFLSRIGLTALSKFSLTVFPVAILAYFPSVFGLLKDEYLLYVPFGIVALSLIPHFIYYYKDQKLIYITSVFYFLVMLLLYDIVMIEIATPEIEIIPIIKGNLIFYKLSQFAIFSFINLSVFYLRRRNSIYEDKLEFQSKALECSNKELKENKEELQVQNIELISYQDELNAKNEILNKALTDLRAAQEKLIESEKMASLGILTAGVAHEINNPVNYIYSGINALENYMEEHCEKDIEQVKPFFEAVDQGIDRTINIVKSLGRYSRSEDLPWSKTDMHQVIEDTLVMLFNQYKGRINIIKNYNAEKVLVLGNEGQLHQVFLNILLNAVQAIPDKGHIDIRTENVNKDLNITVKDSGNGIDEDVLKHIFDPFFTTKDPGEGTGLGLSISQKIIHEHNGIIQVDSVLQKGTTFVILLPLITEK